MVDFALPGAVPLTLGLAGWLAQPAPIASALGLAAIEACVAWICWLLALTVYDVS